MAVYLGFGACFIAGLVMGAVLICLLQAKREFQRAKHHEEHKK